MRNAQNILGEKNHIITQYMVQFKCYSKYKWIQIWYYKDRYFNFILYTYLYFHYLLWLCIMMWYYLFVCYCIKKEHEWFETIQLYLYAHIVLLEKVYGVININ